jgi:hypothetical protein
LHFDCRISAFALCTFTYQFRTEEAINDATSEHNAFLKELDMPLLP